MNSPYDMIAVLGPTASGKTTLATHLAYRMNGEIISADSRQLYRGMDIGTGKDLGEYCVNGVPIPYHLIDIVDAGYKYSVFEYQRDFLTAYKDIQQRGKTVILAGGTGMYMDAVANAYDLLPVPPNETLRADLATRSDEELLGLLMSLKQVHNTTDNSRKRMIRAIEIAYYKKDHAVESMAYTPIRTVYFGILIDREVRRERITLRLKQRLEQGMVEEVRALIARGVTIDDLVFYGLEYKYLALHLSGQLSYDEMQEKLNVAIHQFAKRQMTWFRGMERKGIVINWINGEDSLEEKLDRIDRILHYK